MKDGRNDFVVTLNRRDIVEITDNAKQLRIEDLDFIRNATLDDVTTAYALLSLQEFFEKRRVPLPFKVVLSE